MHSCHASSRLHKGARWWDVRDENFPWTDEPESIQLTIEVDGAVAAGSWARRRALEEVTTRRALHVHARGGTGVTEGLRARREWETLARHCGIHLPGAFFRGNRGGGTHRAVRARRHPAVCANDGRDCNPG